jgi:flagellar basal body-associated protein FliL
MSTTETPRGKLSPLVITLIAICGVLLLVVVAVTFLLIGQNTGSGGSLAATPSGSSNSATPIAEPSASAPQAAQSPAPKPVDKSTRFTAFSAPTTITCDPDAENHPKIQVSWSSANAVKAYWAPHKGDASDGTGYPVPVSGNQDGIVDNPHEYDCGNGDHQDNTITLVGPKGEKVSKSWTVTEIR